MNKQLTCIECPMGCLIEVEVENGAVKSVKGNTCLRGKMYAENEVICPLRVVTSTVKTVSGKMVSVKTDKPVRKSEIFEVMKKINSLTLDRNVVIGDVILANIDRDANLVATQNYND